MTVLRACWDLCLIPVFFEKTSFTSCNTNHYIFVQCCVRYFLLFVIWWPLFAQTLFLNVCFKIVFVHPEVTLCGWRDVEIQELTYVCFVFCFFGHHPKWVLQSAFVNDTFCARCAGCAERLQDDGLLVESHLQERPLLPPGRQREEVGHSASDFVAGSSVAQGAFLGFKGNPRLKTLVGLRT